MASVANSAGADLRSSASESQCKSEEAPAATSGAPQGGPTPDRPTSAVAEEGGPFCCRRCCAGTWDEDELCDDCAEGR